jgi:hypothetical protein
MNVKKIGIVLFLLIAVAGFCLSEVSAGNERDIVEYNGVYIENDFNMATTHSTNTDEIWEMLKNDRWVIPLKSDAKSFQSAAGRKDSRGNLQRSNVGYLINRIEYLDYQIDWFHYYLDFRGPETRVGGFTALRGNTITGSFDKNIVNAKNVLTETRVTFNGKNFKIKINPTFDFYSTDVKERITPVNFTFEDGSYRAFNIDVFKN